MGGMKAVLAAVFLALAAGVGYGAAGSWTDAAQSFDIHLLTAP